MASRSGQGGALALALLLLCCSNIALGRMFVVQQQELAQDGSGESTHTALFVVEQEGTGGQAASTMWSSIGVNPLSWLLGQLDAIERAQNQMIHTVLVPSLVSLQQEQQALERLQDEQVVAMEPEKMLHRLGCSRFNAAIKDYARQQAKSAFNGDALAQPARLNEASTLLSMAKGSGAAEESEPRAAAMDETLDDVLGSYDDEGDSGESYDALSDRVAEKLVDMLEEAYSLVYGDGREGSASSDAQQASRASAASTGSSSFTVWASDNGDASDDNDEYTDEYDEYDYEGLVAEADAVLSELESEYFGEEAEDAAAVLSSSSLRGKASSALEWLADSSNSDAEGGVVLPRSAGVAAGSAHRIPGLFSYEYEYEYDYEEDYYVDSDSGHYYLMMEDDYGAGVDAYSVYDAVYDDGYEAYYYDPLELSVPGSLGDGDGAFFALTGSGSSLLDWLIGSIVVQMLPDPDATYVVGSGSSSSGYSSGASSSSSGAGGASSGRSAISRYFDEDEDEDDFDESMIADMEYVDVSWGKGPNYEEELNAAFEKKKAASSSQPGEPGASFTAEVEFFFPFFFPVPIAPGAVQYAQQQPWQGASSEPSRPRIPEPFVVVDNDLDMHFFRSDGSLNWGLVALAALGLATLAVAVGFIVSALQLWRAMRCRRRGSGFGRCLVRRGSNGDLFVTPLTDGAGGCYDEEAMSDMFGSGDLDVVDIDSEKKTAQLKFGYGSYAAVEQQQQQQQQRGAPALAAHQVVGGNQLLPQQPLADVELASEYVDLAAGPAVDLASTLRR